MIDERDAGPLDMPEDLLPLTLLQWYLIQRRTDLAAYRRINIPRLTATLSLSREQDGRRWLRLRVIHEQRLPTWEELLDAKRQFLSDRYAYQVFPNKARNAHLQPFFLNLFSCLDVPKGIVLPDFTRGNEWP